MLQSWESFSKLTWKMTLPCLIILAVVSYCCFSFWDFGTASLYFIENNNRFPGWATTTHPLCLVSLHHTTKVAKYCIGKQYISKDAPAVLNVFYSACLIYGNQASEEPPECTVLSSFRFWSRTAFSARIQRQPGKPNHMPESKWDYISL